MWKSGNDLECEDESMDVLQIVAEEVDDLIDGLLLRLQVLVEPGRVHHSHLGKPELQKPSAILYYLYISFYVQSETRRP